MSPADYPANPAGETSKSARRRQREQTDLAMLLKAWGTATLNRFVRANTTRSTHVLAQQRDMAPGTVEKALRQLVARDGRSRRRALAKAAGIEKMPIAPVWAVEPVRATNDAGRPQDLPEVAHDLGIPDDLLWLDRAIARMSRINTLRALCVREEYCGVGSQRIKAARVAEQYGGALSLRQYRLELEKARVWLSGYRRVEDRREFLTPP